MARKTAVKKSKASKHSKESHKKDHHASNHYEKKESKSSFFSKIGAFFSEALKAPPEPKVQTSKIEKSDENSNDSSAQYELASHVDGQKMEVSVKDEDFEDDDSDDDSDEDDAPDEESDGKSEILSILNEATNKWKESGDTGLHLEPPKSWSERMRTLWSGVNVQSTRLSGRLKVLMHEVSERVAARQKEAKAEGVKVKTDNIVKEEWKSVLTKLESVSTPSEREEIEKIYKQLENV